jgi:uncharacterized protein YdhG (YjbR/CyaY superfamily)
MATRMNMAIKTIDQFIAGFPKETQLLLEKMRAIIKKAAPKAEETISYGIPTFTLNGNLVHFSGYKSHIGFYPGAAGVQAFKKELSVYKGAKGSVQFPLDKPLPIGLITQIVKFRVLQNVEKKQVKKKASKPTTTTVKPKKSTDEELVAAYINKLDAAARKDIEALRKIIKAGAPKLSERIKWNAPSYYYKEDIVTFGPYKTHKLLLVFHHPAVVKVKSALLQGDYKDRRLVYFKDSAEAASNKKELTRIINEIIKFIGKK